MTTRLNVNINDECASALRKMAERNETTVTEIVRRAISVFDYVDRAARDGKTVQIIGPDDVTTLAIIR
jgi:predicted transcriptional regulator